MRVMTASEVLKTPADTALDCVGGVVGQVWPRRTGTSQYGAWSIQNLLIGDGANKVKVKLTGHQELGQDWAGHKLWIIAGVGKKGQSIGLKTELDTYKGETKLQVAVNENAQLTGEDPSATKGEAPHQPPPSQQAAPPAEQRRWPSQDPDQPGEEQGPPQVFADLPPGLPLPARQQTPPPQTSAPRDTSDKGTRKAWAKVDAGLLKLMRLRLRTMSTAMAIKRKCDEAGWPMSADHVEKIDMYLAIELTRNGLLADVPDCDPPMPRQDYGAGSSDGLPPGLD